MSGTWLSALVAAGRVAWKTLPESMGLLTGSIRLVGIPVLTSLFYLAIASGDGNGRLGLSAAVASGLAVGSVSSSIAVATLIASDRFNGTLPYLIVASHARFLSWAGRFFVVSLIGIATAITGTVLPVVIVGGSVAGSSGCAIVVALLITAPAAAGLGFLIGAISLRLRDALMIANVAEYVLPLLVGAVAPLASMPTAIAWIARALPLSHVIQAGRDAAVSGFGGDYWSEVTLGLTLGAAWLAAGWGAWHYFERQVRVAGTAESLAI